MSHLVFGPSTVPLAPRLRALPPKSSSTRKESQILLGTFFSSRIAIFSLSIALGLSLAVGDGWSAALAPNGTWSVEGGSARIRIEPCPRRGDGVCGYVVWSKGAALAGTSDHDAKNPVAANRARSLLGVQILLGLKADGDGFAGKVYNAKDGKTYDATIERGDEGHLTLKGCILRFLCQSQTWTKVGDTLPGQLTGLVDKPGGPRSDEGFAAKSKQRPARAGTPE